MRIVIDLDGTLCHLKKSWQSYRDVLPIWNAVEKVQTLKEQGYYIIIQTARHMQTCESNLGRVNARISKDTIEWLERHHIPFDEIYFGKPNADIYLDDNAKTFLGWDAINDIESYDKHLINIVIPMAGLGSRFSKAWYTLPKPLIDVKGKPMFWWAASSFQGLGSMYQLQYIFIILREHQKIYHLDKKILEYFPTAHIIAIDEVTWGQAETVLKAKAYIDNYNKLIIFNSDTYMIFEDSSGLFDDPSLDGMLAYFPSENPAYSYASLDDYQYVDRVAEKEVISPYASNGMYYFRRGNDFVRFADRMIMHNIRSGGEFYVAPVYNSLIQVGKRIALLPLKENWILGTPNELEYFLQHFSF